MISKTPVLMDNDLEKPAVLQVDASEMGLGGALLQPNPEGKLQPASYTSCSLSPAERGYSQIEDCRSICQAFSKFDQWLFGKSDIEVDTDHQPLKTPQQRTNQVTTNDDETPEIPLPQWHWEKRLRFDQTCAALAAKTLEENTVVSYSLLVVHQVWRFVFK